MESVHKALADSIYTIQVHSQDAWRLLEHASATGDDLDTTRLRGLLEIIRECVGDAVPKVNQIHNGYLRDQGN